MLTGTVGMGHACIDTFCAWGRVPPGLSAAQLVVEAWTNHSLCLAKFIEEGGKKEEDPCGLCPSDPNVAVLLLGIPNPLWRRKSSIPAVSVLEIKIAKAYLLLEIIPTIETSIHSRWAFFPFLCFSFPLLSYNTPGPLLEPSAPFYHK